MLVIRDLLAVGSMFLALAGNAPGVAQATAAGDPNEVRASLSAQYGQIETVHLSATYAFVVRQEGGDAKTLLGSLEYWADGGGTSEITVSKGRSWQVDVVEHRGPNGNLLRRQQFAAYQPVPATAPPLVLPRKITMELLELGVDDPESLGALTAIEIDVANVAINVPIASGLFTIPDELATVLIDEDAREIERMPACDDAAGAAHCARFEPSPRR